VLGDSIVFGGQVPEQQRLTERLEVLLHDRGLARARVINVATPGWLPVLACSRQPSDAARGEPTDQLASRSAGVFTHPRGCT
jgi:hypothetical protein